VTPPEDPTALAQTIATAAADAAGTTEKGRRAALVASRYTRQISLGAYRTLMNKLLRNRVTSADSRLEEEAA
jgi:hypothetical protein